jgi:hypothetical protein
MYLLINSTLLSLTVPFQTVRDFCPTYLYHQFLWGLLENIYAINVFEKKMLTTFGSTYTCEQEPSVINCRKRKFYLGLLTNN